MQYIYHPKTTISDLQIYGSSAPRIPEVAEKSDEFRPPRKGEMFLSTCLTCEVAEENWPDSSPRIILRKKKVLTEIEREYGDGETVESVWKKKCPHPEKYGTPKFGKPPEGRLVGFVFRDCVAFDEDVSTIYWTPRVYAFKLTEIEKCYGEGETPESVWAKYCPNPEDYEKPAYGIVGGSRPYGVIHWPVGRLGAMFHSYLPSKVATKEKYIYAAKLNEWQKTYSDESITDAKTLEAKLRELGKLGDDEEIEPEIRHAEPGECFVGVGMWRSGIARHRHEEKRAIIRKKAPPKKRFLKIPLGSNGMFFNDQGLWQWPCMFPTGTIIEE